MFFNKQICFLSDSLNFGLLNLFNGISLSILFACCLKDLREISRSQMNQGPKLVQAMIWILWLWFVCYGCLCCYLLGFRITVFFGFGTVDFMWGPMFLLTLHSAIVNFFAPSASEELFFSLVACLTLFDDFGFTWLLSWEVWGLNLLHLFNYNLKNLK